MWLCILYFIFYSFIHFIHVAYGILVSPPGIQPEHIALEAKVLTTGLPRRSLVIMCICNAVPWNSKCNKHLKTFFLKERGRPDLTRPLMRVHGIESKKAIQRTAWSALASKHPLATVGRGYKGRMTPRLSPQRLLDLILATITKKQAWLCPLEVRKLKPRLQVICSLGLQGGIDIHLWPERAERVHGQRWQHVTRSQRSTISAWPPAPSLDPCAAQLHPWKNCQPVFP